MNARDRFTTSVVLGSLLGVTIGCAASGTCPPGTTDRAPAPRVELCEYRDGSGRARERRSWPNGALEREGEYRMAERVGLWRFGYMNGRVHEQGHYVANQRVGEWTTWHPEGGTLSTRHYRAGRLHGPFASFDRGGRLVERGRFENGRREGVWTRWYPGAKGAVETLYAEGERVRSRELAADEAARARRVP